MKTSIFALILSLLAIFAQAQQASEATVRKMIAATDIANTHIETLKKALNDAKKNKDEYAPVELFDRMIAGMNVDSLTNLLIPVYKKNYTEQDLQKAIQFYETVEGKKMAVQNSIIMQQSSEVLGKWIQGISKKVNEEMLKRDSTSYNRLSEAELEKKRMDSFAMAEQVTADSIVAVEAAEEAAVYDNPAAQKAQKEYDEAVAKAYKKREKALAKIKK